jgi:cell division septum initiation protein DivIVA
MAATMTDSRHGHSSRLRVTRHGYDPADVHSVLAAARARLVGLADRVCRAEAANVALVAEVQQLKERARTAEAERRRMADALAAAESTVATSVAEVQIRADHLVERARCEAGHLTLRAQEEAQRVRDEIQREQEAHEAAMGRTAEALDLDADPGEEMSFSRFMSDTIADEPSREWVMGAT